MDYYHFAVSVFVTLDFIDQFYQIVSQPSASQLIRLAAAVAPWVYDIMEPRLSTLQPSKTIMTILPPTPTLPASLEVQQVDITTTISVWLVMVFIIFITIFLILKSHGKRPHTPVLSPIIQRPPPRQCVVKVDIGIDATQKIPQKNDKLRNTIGNDSQQSFLQISTKAGDIQVDNLQKLQTQKNHTSDVSNDSPRPSRPIITLTFPKSDISAGTEAEIPCNEPCQANSSTELNVNFDCSDLIVLPAHELSVNTPNVFRIEMEQYLPSKSDISIDPSLLLSKQTAWTVLQLKEPTVSLLRHEDLNWVKNVHVAPDSSGRISLATNTSSGKALIVKRIDGAISSDPRRLFPLSEIRALQRLGVESTFWHTFLEGGFKTGGEYIMIMARYLGGDLPNLLKEAGGCLRHNMAKFYAAELILAIQFIHKQDIIHRDLRPANILLDSEGHLVIGDFGKSIMFSNSVVEEDNYPLWAKKKELGGDNFPLMRAAFNPHTISQTIGTTLYSAPEVQHGKPYSYGVDYWSMGVIYHELITGQLPYLTQIVDGKQEYTSPLVVELKMRPEERPLQTLERKFLTTTLSVHPKDRPSVKAMKMDDLWYNIDWEKMSKREVPVPQLA